jgi:formylmethanofuran dehydrogenase subunit D
MAKVCVKLISGRTSQQGVGLEVGKTSEQYFNSVSYVELSQEDAEALSVDESQTVVVTTDYGFVVLKSRVSKVLDRGLAFVPYGLWSNQLFASETGGTGMPLYKGIEATIELSDKDVSSFEELVTKLKEGNK